MCRGPYAGRIQTVSTNGRGFTAQYISSSPPGGMAGALSFLGFSAIRASLVSSSVATLAAFCRAVRVTLVGSMTPALTRSS